MVTMSLGERVAIGLIILSLILGTALIWLTMSSINPCEELGTWAKPLCKHGKWPGEPGPFSFPLTMRGGNAGAGTGEV